MTADSQELSLDKGDPDPGGVAIETVRPSSQPSIQGAPLLTLSSVLNFFADAELHTVAGIGGLIVVIVLTIFGRIGSLIVGVLAGLLIHASLEKRQENKELWKLPATEVAVRKEVILL